VVDLLWEKYSATAADLVHLEYGYDRVSNRTWREDLIAQSNSKDFDELYAYDGMHRLQDMQRGLLNAGHTAIPWPMHQNAGRRSPVVYKGLSKAVRNEFNQAIAHCWGVSGQSVTKWRKAMGVGRETPGSHAIRVERSKEPWFAEMQRKAWSKA